MIFKKTRLFTVIEIALVIIIITITFFPALRKATIYRDDWYYVMDRLIGGPQAFHEMFRIDRPARGYFFEAYFRLFGAEPAPYHMAAFFWRLMTGLSALWLFRRLWPKHPQATLAMAILLIIYPEYTRWLEGFEDQPKIVSLFLQITSIALTLQAMKASRNLSKILLWAASILTGWGYLALIDYAIGMEIFRYLCVFVFTSREHLGENLLRRGLAAIRTGFPAFFIAGGFLFWRIFLFKNVREATDISLQLGALVDSPVLRGTWWLINLFRSVLNEAVFAWISPFFQELFSMHAREILIGLLTAVIAAAAVYAVSVLNKNVSNVKEEPDQKYWQLEAIGIGITGVVFGVLPVIMANRVVLLGAYSHYAVPASLASATLVVGLVSCLPWRRARLTTVSVLVFMAVISQYAASSQILSEEEKISAFWQQIAWRATGIRAGTTLAVIYPSVNYGEDIDAVNGPANFLYFPETTNQLPAEYPLFALKQSAWISKDVIGGGESTEGYRTHFGKVNYDNMLVISQPSESACVHVIDSRWPWFTTADDDAVLLIGQNSKIENLVTNSVPPKLPASIFGPEPSHGWCYYFQKASLALQQEDWKKISALGAEALSLKLHPQEVTEWIPFLQAYAILGDIQNIKDAASKINQASYNRVQACQVLTKMQAQGYTFTPEVKKQIAETFCSK